jgi:hypothetical protein
LAVCSRQLAIDHYICVRKRQKMKPALIILFSTILIYSCKSNEKNEKEKLSTEEKEKALQDSSRYTSIQWLDPKVKDLGDLVHDRTVEFTYRFKNTGGNNLIFENVWAQCGCTIPEKPDKAYAPGEEGIIKAKFNGTGQGFVSKAIYIKANIKPDANDTLHFTGQFVENQ